MFTETQLKYEITRIYMDKNIPLAIDMCRNYINSKNGKVHDDFFLMLFDMYKAENNKVQYVKLSKTYSDLTGTIRKIWEDREEIEVVSNKNLFISDGALNLSDIEKLHTFYTSCKSKKFGRIDLNKINLIKSHHLALKKLLDILYEFRKSDVHITLMGDNRVLNFNFNQFDNMRLNSEKVIEKKIQDEQRQREQAKNNQTQAINKKPLLSSFFDKKELLKSMIDEIDNKEKNIYLLKLEILQWKGYEKEYVALSIDYCSKFGFFPPDYNKNEEKIKIMSKQNASEITNGVVSLEKYQGIGLNNASNDVLKYHVKEINNQNLNYLISYLNTNKNFVIFLDFSNVDFITYEAAKELLLFMKQYRKEGKYLIQAINVNKMIEIQFDMIGLSNYIVVVSQTQN